MGIFSSKKKTYVSSVSYPLGEDDEERVDYLQYTVLNATLQNRPVGEAITQGYLRGQGMSLRNAFKYARDQYTLGVPMSAARFLDQPDTSQITPVVQPNFPGAEILYLTTVVGPADHEWWAEQYLTTEFGYDRTLQQFMRPPAGVEPDAAVAYDLEPSGLIRILLLNQDGATKIIDFRPSGYIRMGTFIHSCYQARTIFIEQDETTTRPATEGEVDTVQVATVITDRVGETQEKLTRIETDILNGVATVHTKITVTVTSRPQYFLYRIGSGVHPSLDLWSSSDNLQSPYYPAIPLRVNNVDFTDDDHQKTDLYKTSKKLLDKVGVKIDKVAESLNDNESIKDIDYAFVMFGVALNSRSPEGKKYLYRFFEHLRGISSGGAATKTRHEAWVQAYLGGAQSTPPDANVVEIYHPDDRKNNHDIKIQWDYIDTTLHPGEIAPGAKIGDVDISMGSSRTLYVMHGMGMTVDSSKLYARRQVTADSFEQLEISGLIHENFIYGGKSVTVTAYDAFYDPDEEGFIIPLNQQIIRATPIVELTNLSYQCMHMVLNCYQVVKQKWYQSSWFKVLLVIVAIIVIVVTWGTATPAVVTWMAAAFGGTMLAMALAATIYVLAMMVIMNIVMKVSVDVFGEKWGPLIASIVALVAMQWDSLAAMGTNIAAGTITANMVIQASIAALSSYGAYAQGQLSDVQKKLMGLETEFDRQMKEIEDLTKANLDTNTDLIDIFGMTDATNLQFESSSTFLGRTLLVGGDVVDITNGLIENFVEVGLRLPTTG